VALYKCFIKNDKEIANLLHGTQPKHWKPQLLTYFKEKNCCCEDKGIEVEEWPQLPSHGNSKK